MLIGLIVVIFYFLLMIFIGFVPARVLRRRAGIITETDESFFLSEKKLSVTALLISTAATNFSAFTILGLSGAGYRMGYAFYPVMAFGTGFMALSMYLIGSPLRKLGRERGYISPVDFIQDRYGSVVLSRVFAVVLVILTLPYLALQPMSAGIILETFFGVPYKVGVITCSIIVGLYTTRGGMRAVVKTDLIQGVIILVLAAAAYASVVRYLGGFSEAHALVVSAAPQLLERFGAAGANGPVLGPSVLAGYILLWFLADPMFPQLNQRLLAAKDNKTLERMVIIYPIVTMLLFFLTISIGVLGAGVMPELSSADSDRIWPALIAESAGPVLACIFMIAPLAAIMSTLDSQLLSLSSILKRDLLGNKHSSGTSIRLITATIAAVGLVIALFPPSNILDFINKSSFLGYAALAPLFFAGLYCKRVNRFGALAALLTGELVTALLGFGIIRITHIPHVFIIISLSLAALIAGSWFGRDRSAHRRSDNFPVQRFSKKLPPGWALLFIILFFLCCNFFFFRLRPEGGDSFAGLPVWMYFQAGLCLILSAAYFLFFRRMRRNTLK